MAQAIAPEIGQAIGQAIPGAIGAGVDLLKGGAQAIRQKIFGGGNLKGLAAGAAPIVGAKEAAAALGPKAAAAVGGLAALAPWFVLLEQD